MAKNYTKKTIYVAGPLADALRKRPDIDFTRICQEALKAAAGLSPASSQPSPEMVSEIARVEGLAHDTRITLQKIARLAASQGGMIVLTGKESETYKQILDIGINQFVHKTKKEAIEEYRVELEKQRLSRKRSRKSKAANLAPKPSTARCVDCDDPYDVPCSKCGAPLCWSCWAGKDLEAPATELCQRCLNNEPSNVSGSQKSPENPK
jgi:hypothetical protein